MAGLAGVVILISLALAAAQAPPPDSVEAARQQYASADYESALATLDRLPAPAAPDAAAEVERYRALCLMALGRTSDAEVAIERIVRNNPSYQLDEQEPPRVRAAFASVRTRVLPDVARAMYTDAKAAYDRKDYPGAVTAFQRTLVVVDSVESADPALRDLRTLASGFLDLSRAAMPPPPIPAAVPAVTVAPSASPTDQERTAPAAESETGPEVLQQELPPWNPAWLRAQFESELRGAVEVVIDETGAVTSARIAEPVHPAYDQQLVAAAARWRYRPATRNGKPVVSTKRVVVVLRPRE